MKIYHITISSLSGIKNKTGGEIWTTKELWIIGKRKMKKIVEAIRGISKNDCIVDIGQVKKEMNCIDKWVEKYSLF